MKNKLLMLGSLSALVIPAITVVSCNVKVGREQKDNTISDKELFESPAAQKLSKILNDKFKQTFKNKLWKDFIFSTMMTNVTWDNTNKEFVSQRGVEFTDSRTISNLASENGFSKPFSNFEDIEWEIWRNTYFDSDVQSLLNNIKTVYNRRKMVYPTSTSLVNNNGEETANISYEIDLISPMKRRFMKTYQTIDISVPNKFVSTNTIWSKLKMDDPLSDSNTIYSILDQYFNYPLNNRSVKTEWFTDSKYMDKSIIDWNSLIFMKQANDKYKIQYDKHTPTGVTNLGVLSDTTSKGTLPKEFDKTDSLQDVATYLEEQIFAGNSNAFIRSLFTDVNGIEGKIEFASLAGTSINGTNIDDYVTNLLAENSVPLGHFNIYIKNKKVMEDGEEVIKPISWYKTDISMGKGTV